MYHVQAIYRKLFEGLIESKSNSVYEDVFAPWLVEAHAQREWLTQFAARPGDPYPEADIVELCKLYALSRVNDLCIDQFQPQVQPGEHWYTCTGGTNITVDEYLRAFSTLGLTIVKRAAFHPFFHEIVMVEQSSNEDDPIEIVEIRWPCLMLGNMMFSRAGVAVRGGRNYIKKEVAENSTIYWTYCRRYKRTNDLSHGWGSNSQWRTDFRRDYFVDGNYYYNVDVEPLVDVPAHRKFNLDDESVVFDEWSVGSATRLQRIELLKNRCLIHADIQPDTDFWPYEDFYNEAE